MADPKPSDVTFKNISNGPRGVHSASGLVFLEPGEERELSVHAHEVENARTAEHFEIDGKAPAKPAKPAKGEKGEKAPKPTDEELIAGFSESETEAFGGLDDKAKAEFLADRRKQA